MGHRSHQLPPALPRPIALVALVLLRAALVAGSLPGGVGRADDLPPPPPTTAALVTAAVSVTGATTATFKGT